MQQCLLIRTDNSRKEVSLFREFELHLLHLHLLDLQVLGEGAELETSSNNDEEMVAGHRDFSKALVGDGCILHDD